MGTVGRIADRTLGYLGLFLIGAVSWVAEHAGAAGRPTPAVGARPTLHPAPPVGVPHQRPLATAQRAGG
jgi:hypothetical protein